MKILPFFIVLFMALSLPARAADFTIAAYPRHGLKADMSDWIEALGDLKSIGATGMLITKRWNEIETGDEKYDLTQLGKDLTSNAKEGRKVLFGIQLINTVKREVPGGLEAKAWNDPAMIARFKALMMHLKAESPAPPAYISIGNEVDVYFERHPDELGDYLAFCKQAAEVIRKDIFPDAKIGITVTYEGLVKGREGIIRQLVAAGDVAIFTYYPLIDMQPLPLDQVPNHLDAIVAAAQGKPVLLQEVGFPSGKRIGASEEMQAAFFKNVIAGIQARPQIAFASLFLLHDFDDALCDTFLTYYGAGVAPKEAKARFRDFLCTLGLKETGGREKPAWGVVKKALQQR